MEYVKNQGLKSVSGYKAVMSTQYTTLVITPGFNQYNTTLKQMILVYQIVNLHK